MEAIVSPSDAGRQTIVNHGTLYKGRSWSFDLCVSDKNRYPRLRVWDTDKNMASAVFDGSNGYDPFPIKTGETYSLAAVFDSPNNEITLYGSQKGVNNGYKSTTVALESLGPLKDSSDSLTIGIQGQSREWIEAYPMAGDMDEVRFSSGALSESDLLMATPEPGTTCLAILAAAAGVFAVWRKKRKQDSADSG